MPLISDDDEEIFAWEGESKLNSLISSSYPSTALYRLEELQEEVDAIIITLLMFLIFFLCYIIISFDL